MKTGFFIGFVTELKQMASYYDTMKSDYVTKLKGAFNYETTISDSS
ncbi:hypothetical protein HMPREF0555_0874 [Leuconostoc mesenteroides subsp. cremoris ATCC 19254]|uniref:Uncharacterized protein n=1 Tax=Leuconostoc mesenteroides subsp. cremoris ATCC 19254 TaxID=586220 RepID=C2KJQ8_LEUMC|nr:hypothetical protein HMPREF0555_0874 [Leuconostoc mesenteroides subsp. cremoris ATCC 19254]